ncbi:MAG: GAF domain-containing protein [Anaerolineae bacterium]
MNQPTSILIADGDPTRRAQLAGALGDRPVETVDSAKAALAALRTNRFILAVIGATLADSTGPQLLKRMGGNPLYASIPTLVVGTPDQSEALSACLLEGAAEYLVTAGELTPPLVRARVEAILRTHALQKRVNDLLNVVIPIGIQLSAERDFDRLLETILIEAQGLTNADAGTLYLRNEASRTLEFVIVRNTSLGLSMGGTSGVASTLPDIPLYTGEGSPNEHNVASYTALHARTVNIAAAYTEAGIDFSGTRAFDERTGYRSQSFLTVPLRDETGAVTGVLQLINAQDPNTGAIVTFDPALHPIVESMAGLATVALKAVERENVLRRQIADLRIEVDEARRAREVEKITDTDYFRRLKERARSMRQGRGSDRQP